jgi:hypothetical protein
LVALDSFPTVSLPWDLVDWAIKRWQIVADSEPQLPPKCRGTLSRFSSREEEIAVILQLAHHHHHPPLVTQFLAPLHCNEN